MQKQDKINVNEIDTALEGNIAGADRLRAEALDRFAGLRQTKERMLTRERARLSLKLGAEHPRVLALTERIAVNRDLHGEARVETERARTETPTAGAGAWLVHGYVRDESGQPAPGLTVALYDRQGFWVRILGHACTDARGYFKLESGALQDPAPGPVYLQVLNGQGQRLFIDKTALTPTAGRVDYREVTLSGAVIPCAPPCGGGEQPGQQPGEGEPCHEAHTWTIQGRVTDSGGRGLAGFIVSVYDKDLLFDDRLGVTETNQSGDYRLVYHTRDFRDLIERRPDLYLKISDRSGNLCFTTEHAVKWNAGRTETINVVLPIGGGRALSEGG